LRAVGAAQGENAGAAFALSLSFALPLALVPTAFVAFRDEGKAKLRPGDLACFDEMPVDGLIRIGDVGANTPFGVE
jgi:hypothetical protein